MARSARAYRGAKRQKEIVRKARREEKRRRRLDRKKGVPPIEGQEPRGTGVVEGFPPVSPSEPSLT
jgi:hypothetical protein